MPSARVVRNRRRVLAVSVVVVAVIAVVSVNAFGARHSSKTSAIDHLSISRSGVAGHSPTPTPSTSTSRASTSTPTAPPTSTLTAPPTSTLTAPPTSTPTVPASSSTTSSAPTGESAVDAALQAAGGDMSVAVYDRVSGRLYTLNDTPRFYTASVVKLSIMAETLLQLQDGRAPSSAVTEQLEDMIEHSDNDDASDLWDSAGGGPAVIGYDQRVGATHTTAGSDDQWGLTVTSAADMVAVMRSVAYPGSPLNAASQAQADSLLAQVESDQKWGASGGVPTGVEVDVKDGWLPYGVGWAVNSVAHVHGEGRDYVVALMSRTNVTEAAGIARLELVSAAVWKAAAIS